MILAVICFDPCNVVKDILCDVAIFTKGDLLRVPHHPFCLCVARRNNFLFNNYFEILARRFAREFCDILYYFCYFLLKSVRIPFIDPVSRSM